MENKKRNSSIELLRILCILMIIMAHYSAHGIFDLESETVQYNYIQILSMFGKSGCMIFSMITGYFLIDKKIDNKFYIKIIMLAIKMIIYSTSIYLLLMFLGLANLNYSDLKLSLLAPLYGDWYTKNYILLSFFMPFINEIVTKLDKDIYKNLLKTIIIIFFIVNTICRVVYPFDDFGFLFVFYIIGGYIKLYPEDINFNKKKYLNLMLVSLMIMIFSVPLLNYLADNVGFLTFHSISTYFGNANNIVSFIFSISLFILFLNKTFYSSIINVVASTTLGIYLIHDNRLIRDIIWNQISPNHLYQNNPYLHSIIKVICIFVICSIVDYIYQIIIEKPIKKSLYKRVESK